MTTPSSQRGGAGRTTIDPSIRAGNAALTNLRDSNVTTFRTNLAVHVLLPLRVTDPSLQSASPVQPANFELAAGTGVKVITFPAV